MTESEDALRDAPLEHEITLVGDLVVAATSHEGPLDQDEIDEALGLPDGDSDHVAVGSSLSDSVVAE